jgi:hypothetical protein
MRFVIMALAAAAAFGQTNRKFQLTQKENPQELEEIAAMDRSPTCTNSGRPPTALMWCVCFI